MERRAYMVVDAGGEPAKLFNEVAPIRWTQAAAARLAEWLNGLPQYGRRDGRPCRVVKVDVRRVS